MNATKKLKSGFTLIELLVVIAILGILSTIALANFRSSQIKARDVQRKADLHQIGTALEAYMTDHNGLPPAQDGQIKACGCRVGTLPCDWGTGNNEFCDINNTVYMRALPGDPTGSPNYCYLTNGTSFKLYAKLENANDPEIIIPSENCGEGGYNYGRSSANTRP